MMIPTSGTTPGSSGGDTERATNKTKMKTYFVWRQEWILWVVLLGFLGGGRTYLLVRNQSSSSPVKVSAEQNLFTDVSSLGTLKRGVHHYCTFDRMFLCGLPSAQGSCKDRYGDILMNLLSRNINQNEDDCSLSSLFENRFHFKFPLFLNLTKEDDAIIEDEDNHALARLILYSLPNLDQMAVGASLHPDEERRAITWILSFLLQLFVNLVPPKPMEGPVLDDHRFRRNLVSSDNLVTTALAKEAGLISKAWSKNEVLDIMEWCARHGNIDKFYVDRSFRIFSTPQLRQLVLEVVEDLRSATPKITDNIGLKKHEFKIFYEPSTAQCLYQHYDYGTLLSDNCGRAIQQAPHKYREIQLEEGGGFTFVSHTMAWGGNFIFLVGLVSLFSARKTLEKRMEKGRRRLEQELHDPFLRQVLENKAAQLPEGPERDEFLTRLERRTETWNSKEIALKLLRKRVRIFRRAVLFYLCAVTALSIGLSIFHVASWARYLEMTFCNVAIITATYWIPTEDSEDTTSSKNSILQGGNRGTKTGLSIAATADDDDDNVTSKTKPLLVRV